MKKLKLIYGLMVLAMNVSTSEVEIRKEERIEIVHEGLQKSKLGAVLYTAIPFSVFTIFSVIVNVVCAHHQEKNQEKKDDSKIYKVVNYSSEDAVKTQITKEMIICIGTTIIVLAADIAIKLFTNYYGKLSLFFRPMKFIAVTIPMNLIVSPVSILFVLVLLGIKFDQINTTLFDNLIPDIVVNRVLIGIGALVYIAVCNLILPIVLHSVNHKKHFLFNKNVTKEYSLSSQLAL